ncbi:fibronectin type III domain-containing protein [Helicobacter mesocricetorum]|uniref:fibronectin type III domain-containing protein n=1 Tax=Helicobacter mesocricetorum TaxID=87012 RepID=UPI000CF17FC9|nr:fibronectin type III domain-containing protein [Helicobacter mesocricetorum]
MKQPNTHISRLFCYAFLFLISYGCSNTLNNPLLNNPLSNFNLNTSQTLNINLTPPDDIRILTDINTIAFEWQIVPDSNIVGYQVYRKKPNEQNFQKVATLDSRFVTHYADTKLAPNTDYLYQFASFDANKNVSSYSPTIEAKTQILAPVSYIKAISNYPRIIKILWNPHPDPRVTGYLIEKKNKNGDWKELTKVPNRFLVEYLDRNLEDNATNEYRIYAYNVNQSLSEPSEVATATTKPKPIPVTNLQATNNLPKKISLQWDKHPNPEITHYTLFRSSLLNFSKLQTLDSSITNYTDIIDKDGQSYQYKIIATDKDGIPSIESSPVTGSTLQVPATPLVTYAQIENNAVVLRWNPQDDRATEYIVYKKSSFFSEILRYNKVLTPEFIDREIAPGQKYHYSVSAIDSNGLESKQTQEITLLLSN